MTAASLTLFPLLAGPRRVARVLAIVPGVVYLGLEPPDQADRSVPDRSGPGPTVVIALLEPGAVRLPFGIVLPEAAAGLAPVSVAGTPVSRGPITVGWGALTLAGVRWPVLNWWNPAVPVLTMPAPALSGSLGFPGPPAEENGELPLELTAGLTALALGRPEDAVQLLIGVGPGPIPPGDDVLCGALATLAAWAPESPARRTLATAVLGAAGRTTVISAALLRAAVTGSVVPQLSTLLLALNTADQTGIDEALTELTGVGTGSGTAMAAGAVQQFRWLSRVTRTAA